MVHACFISSFFWIQQGDVRGRKYMHSLLRGIFVSNSPTICYLFIFRKGHNCNHYVVDGHAQYCCSNSSNFTYFFRYGETFTKCVFIVALGRVCRFFMIQRNVALITLCNTYISSANICWSHLCRILIWNGFPKISPKIASSVLKGMSTYRLCLLWRIALILIIKSDQA